VLLACGSAWGSTQSLGKIAVSTGHGPFALIFWQLVIGVLILGPLALRQGRMRLGLVQLGWAAMIACLGTILPNTAFYISIARLPAGIMSILIATVPLIAFPLALAFGMERFSAARLLGLVCGIAGVALIALPEASLPDAAMAAFLPVAMLGPLFYAAEGLVVARGGTPGMTAVQAMALVSAVGAAIMAPVVWWTGQWFDPLPAGRPEWALVLASAAHACAYAGYVWLAARAGAVFAAQTSYIVTGTGVLWAMLILGERLAPTVWLALAVMLAGLALVQPRAAVQRAV
jgi:drug/metabolite transporter (DMT)-like permease